MTMKTNMNGICIQIQAMTGQVLRGMADTLTQKSASGHNIPHLSIPTPIPVMMDNQ